MKYPLDEILNTEILFQNILYDLEKLFAVETFKLNYEVAPLMGHMS